MERARENDIPSTLHVTIHQTVENQLAAKESPVVYETLERLMRSGLSRHEAIHAIGSVLCVKIWKILNQERPFDVERLGMGASPIPPAKGEKREAEKISEALNRSAEPSA